MIRIILEFPEVVPGREEPLTVAEVEEILGVDNEAIEDIRSIGGTYRVVQR